MSGELRKVCPHCEERLALRTFREHTRLFFDARTHTWTKKRKVGPTIENETTARNVEDSRLVFKVYTITVLCYGNQHAVIVLRHYF